MEKAQESADKAQISADKAQESADKAQISADKAKAAETAEAAEAAAEAAAKAAAAKAAAAKAAAAKAKEAAAKAKEAAAKAKAAAEAAEAEAAEAAAEAATNATLAENKINEYIKIIKEEESQKESIQRKILSYIFKYDDEKIINKRIKLLRAKYKFELSDDDLKSFALHSDFAKGTLDIEQQKTSSTESDITTRDVNTFVDFLAKYKFSYNHSDIDSDIKKLIKLYNKVGINISKATAETMLKAYFPNGKLDKSKLEYLYNKGENDNVEHSNESENLRAFNILLKSLDNQSIDEVIKKVYVDENPDEKQKNVFKQLFSDSNGKFKISLISKLF